LGVGKNQEIISLIFIPLKNDLVVASVFIVRQQGKIRQCKCPFVEEKAIRC
jgi:hypothetical protein